MSRKQFSWRLLAGGSVSTEVEAIGMVSQKMSAALEVQPGAAIAAITGDAPLRPAQTIAIHRPKVHATRRRLGVAKTPAMGLGRLAIKSTPV
jgi:hypothetical protein